MYILLLLAPWELLIEQSEFQNCRMLTSEEKTYKGWKHNPYTVKTVILKGFPASLIRELISTSSCQQRFPFGTVEYLENSELPSRFVIGIFGLLTANVTPSFNNNISFWVTSQSFEFVFDVMTNVITWTLLWFWLRAIFR